MFEQAFKNIDDVLWKEAGCATELDYAEQTSWVLFLKYLDDLEKENEKKAELEGKKYEYKLDRPHRWSAWAAPKKRDGSFDHDKALTGDDLIEFVNRDLFPICSVSGAAPTRTRSNTKSVRFSARSKTSSRAAIRFAMRWNWSMASTSRRSSRSTNFRSSTKLSSVTWAMPGGTGESITRHVRSSAP
jgi:hypothetical protein